MFVSTPRFKYATCLLNGIHNEKVKILLKFVYRKLSDGEDAMRVDEADIGRLLTAIQFNLHDLTTIVDVSTFIFEKAALYEIFFARYLIAAILLFGYIKFKKQTVPLKTYYPFLTILRVLLHLANTDDIFQGHFQRVLSNKLRYLYCIPKSWTKSGQMLLKLEPVLQ